MLKTSASALPPAERAWALCCQGLRSPAIAAELGIPERTIRSWLDRARKELLEERQATRTELLALALERHLAIAAAAWRDHDRTALAAERAERAGDFAAAARMAAIGVRSLTVALAAQREIARLQGLHIIVPPPPPPVDFVIAYRPEGPLDLEALAAEEAAELAALEQAARAEAEAYDAAYSLDDDPDISDNADPSGDLLRHDAFSTPASTPSVSSVLNTSGSPLPVRAAGSPTGGSGTTTEGLPKVRFPAETAFTPDKAPHGARDHTPAKWPTS